MSAKRLNHQAKRKRAAARRTPNKTSRTINKPVGAARKPQSVRRRAASRADPRVDFIDAAARVLGLAIEPSWKPAIKANLEATLRLAASFTDFPLPDEAEPAPIFAA
jgi:hypothetical protein